MKGYNLTLKKNVHKGRQKRETLYRAREPEQLWEADITYIPTVEEGNKAEIVVEEMDKESANIFSRLRLDRYVPW